MPTIEPAELSTSDGAPFSQRYGDVYASRDGALGQARHVFLGGNDLPRRWRDRTQFVIVETGFGLGSNFLATWQAWRDEPGLRRGRHLHYVAVELHPLRADDLRAHAPPELAPLAARLAAAWPLPLPGVQRVVFDEDAVTLTLALGDAASLVPQLGCGADALYLDGFAPERNPAMWSPPLLKSLARLARPGATLATWCTARAVRDALSAAGFELALRHGFGRKRGMLTGRYAPRWIVRRHEPPAAYAGERRAIVVGAGIAGASCALSLAERGWRVEVIDQGPGAAAGASALPAGLLHPQLAADDSRLARLTRAGFLASLARLDLIDPQRAFWRDGGVFQQAADRHEYDAWQALLHAQRLPAAFACSLSREDAARRIGVVPQRGGLWFERGAVVAAGDWVRAMLAAGGDRIRLRTRCPVATLVRLDDGWQVCDPAARALAAAPVVVVAGAIDAPRLLGLRHAPLRAVRGRLTLLAPEALAALRAAVTGDGYVLRAPDGRVAVGATYEPDAMSGVDADGVARAHAGNRARLARLLAAPPPFEADGVFDQVRAVARDRLPLAGAIADEGASLREPDALRGAHFEDLPRLPGAFGLFALGSRGLVLAPLLAQRVAAQIEGEPWPIERDLAASVDPARFLLARLRRGLR